jgi:general nucleoside transport system permease protein
MNLETLIPIFVSTVTAATPLIIAALGVLVSERVGVLNLGVEGMMLVGAVAGFAVGVTSGSLFLGYVAAMTAGMALALIFAFLTLTLQTNQVATGLALALFGVGLSAFVGRPFTGMPIDRVPVLEIPLLSDIPLLGPMLFRYDMVVYFSILLYFAVSRFMYRSASGLRLRAIGEAPGVAHSLGYPVIRVRYLAVIFGGGIRGVADAARSARRLSLRRRHGVATACAGTRRGDSERVPVDAALSRHHRRAGDHLPQSAHDPAQPARIAGTQFSPGRLTAWKRTCSTG